MAISRQKKEETVATFNDSLGRSRVTVFVNFKGMSAHDLTELRAALREKGGEMQVIKKRLIKYALESQDKVLDVLSFEGEIAAVFGFGDEISVVKVLDEAAKEKKLPEFRGGIMGVEILSVEQLKQLAAIPTYKELLARMVGSLNAPPSGLVRVLLGNIWNIVYTLNAIQKQKS